MLTLRSPADSVVTSSAPMNRHPSEACSRPATIRNKVVLPHPEGPSSVTSVPGSIVRSSGFSAVTVP